MKNELMYTFHKNGRSYSDFEGRNRFEAQLNCEVQFHVDLTGAKYEIIRGLRIERTGIVK